MAGGREKIIKLVLQVSVKGIETAVKQIKELRSAITGTTEETRKYTKATDDATKSTKGFTNAQKEQTSAQDAANKKQKETNNGLVNFAKRVGTALSFMARFAVAFAIIEGASQVTVKAYQSAVNYEAALGDLAAISGATSSSVSSLSDTILDTAGSTIFFADELANATKELLRLGFTAEDAQKSIKPIAQFAQATGESLSAAVQLIGKTLNAFGLSTSSTAELTNAFIGAINRSALSVEYLGTSLQYVAPLAQSLGINVQETTAILGVLANNGFRASRAGTALRQILIELGSDAGSLVPILEELALQNISVSESAELVGTRAAAQLIALVNNREEIERLLDVQANYFAAQEANIKQLSTERGEALLLSAAWDRVRISIGRAISFYRLRLRIAGAIDSDTRRQIVTNDSLKTALDNTNLSYEELIERYRELETAQERLDFAEEVLGIKEVNDELERRIELRNDAFGSLREPFFDSARANDTLRENQERVDLLLEELELQSRSARLAENVQKTAEKNVELITTQVNSLNESVRANGFTEESMEEQTDLLYEIDELIENRRQRLEGELPIYGTINDTTEEGRKILEKEIELLTERRNLLIEMRDLINEETDTFSAIFELRERLNKAEAEGDIRAAESLRAEYEQQEANLKILGQLDDFDEYSRRRRLREAEKGREEQVKSFAAILALEESIIEAENKRDTAAVENYNKQLKEALRILEEQGLLEAFNEYAALQIEASVGAESQASALENLTQRMLGVAGAARTGAADAEKFITDLETDIDSAIQSEAINPQEGQKLLDQLLIIYADFLERRAKLEEEARKEKEKEDEESDKERQKLEEEIANQAIESAVEVANTANNAILDSTLARLEAEKAALDSRFDYEEQRLKALQENGVISEQQYSRELEKIKKERVAAENEILEKQFKAQKANSIAQIAIDTASAIIKLWVTPGAAGAPILTAILGAQALAQIAIISSQKFTPTQFAEGGIVQGRSHAQGGVPFTVRGEGGYEMEGGEFIVNKRATAMHRELLESINSYGNAKYNSNMFAAGGVIPQSSGGTMQTELLEQLVALNSAPVRAYVSEDELVRTSKTRIDNDIRSTI
jgi:hypothetical protein